MNFVFASCIPLARNLNTSSGKIIVVRNHVSAVCIPVQFRPKMYSDTDSACNLCTSDDGVSRIRPPALLVIVTSHTNQSHDGERFVIRSEASAAKPNSDPALIDMRRSRESAFKKPRLLRLGQFRGGANRLMYTVR